MTMIAGVYAAFQFLMPMTGWLCVHTIQETFTAFQPYIPWIALTLLLGIGGKMLLDGIQACRRDPEEDIEGIEDRVKREVREKTEGIGKDEDREGIEEREAGIQGSREPVRTGEETAALSFGILILQGIATSIDALSVGFMTASYAMPMAVLSSLIIGAVTFAICMGGLLLGRKAGSLLTGRGDILGGTILIAIGILNVLR